MGLTVNELIAELKAKAGAHLETPVVGIETDLRERKVMFKLEQPKPPTSTSATPSAPSAPAAKP